MSTEDIEDKASLPKFERLGYKDQVLDIINSLKLSSETDKHILKSRFLYEVLNYDARRNHTKKYYNGFRFVVTVGSILLPAILSIGQMDPAKLPKNFESVSYWGAWTISLTVTICNGFLQLFSLDKNYFEFALTSEQLKTEGWQFFQLSGKYEDYEDHVEAYRPFCKSIENIKRKQVEKEFSGKGESKKKKEFNFAKELKKNLPDQYESKQLQSGSGQSASGQSASGQSASGQSAPPSEASILSLLGKIAPDKVKEVAETMATETMGKVEEGIKEGVKEADELTYPTAT